MKTEAYRITLSPHEWTWTQEEQEEMAREIMRTRTINDFTNKAAKELPEGWQIRITVENGCGEVILEDPSSLCHEMCCDDSIEEQFNQALQYAEKHQ